MCGCRRMGDLTDELSHVVHPFARTTLEAQIAALEVKVDSLSKLQNRFSERIDKIGEVTETWMPR